MDKWIWERNKPPVLEPDLLVWGRWFETADRHVAKTQRTRGVRVSTVFLGIDHNLSFYDPHERAPVLFETMVFGGPLDQAIQLRYTTQEDAENGHHDTNYAIKSRWLRRGVSYRRAKKWLESFDWYDVDTARKWYGKNKK